MNCDLDWIDKLIVINCVLLLQVGPSLGIMIIEGKHSELGQGIFISDIQDGSNADKVSCVWVIVFDDNSIFHVQSMFVFNSLHCSLAC